METVRKLSEHDAKAIALLHQQAFEGFFLSSLGLRFLVAFYRSVLQHPQGLGFGFFSGNTLIGFSIGAQQNSGFYTAVLKSNWHRLLWSALPQLLDPSKTFRLLRSFTGSKNTPFTNVPVLLSICVNKNEESKGVGAQLLQVFEKDLVKLGHKSLILCTDTHHNDSVNRFYQKNKYTFVKSFFQGKREMNLYYKQLTP